MAIIRLSDADGRPEEFVTKSTPFPVVMQPGALLPLAGGQRGLSVTSATPVALTVPDNATHGEIYVRTASAVFSRDGIPPTSTRGLQANATDIIVLNSRAQLLGFRAIAVSTTLTLDVEYFELVVT